MIEDKICKNCIFWKQTSLAMGDCKNEETLIDTSCTDSCNELSTNQNFGCVNFHPNE